MTKLPETIPVPRRALVRIRESSNELSRLAMRLPEAERNASLEALIALVDTVDSCFPGGRRGTCETCGSTIGADEIGASHARGQVIVCTACAGD